MKKIILIASLAIIGFAVTAFVAPKAPTDGIAFEGIITYSISVDDQQYAGMAGSSMKEYIKGDKRKLMTDGMFTTMVFQDMNKPNDPIVLLDVMGNKYLLKNDTTKKDTITPTIKYVDGTKKIAGYICHKAEMNTTFQGQSFTTTVYYTEELVVEPVKAGIFKGLKGFPLEYSMPRQGVNVTYSATKVSKESIPDDTFKAHVSGYKPVTAEEMQMDIQKNMQGGN